MSSQNKTPPKRGYCETRFCLALLAYVCLFQMADQVQRRVIYGAADRFAGIENWRGLGRDIPQPVQAGKIEVRLFALRIIWSRYSSGRKRKIALTKLIIQIDHQILNSSQNSLMGFAEFFSNFKAAYCRDTIDQRDGRQNVGHKRLLRLDDECLMKGNKKFRVFITAVGLLAAFSFRLDISATPGTNSEFYPDFRLQTEKGRKKSQSLQVGVSAYGGVMSTLCGHVNRVQRGMSRGQ